MKQLKAGYLLDEIKSLFDYESEDLHKIESLSNWLSYSDIKSTLPEQKTSNSAFNVLKNLIERGLPTRLNFFAYNKLISQSSIFNLDHNDVSIKASCDNNKELRAQFIEALHVIDSRIDNTASQNAYKKSWEELGSAFEEDFIFKTLPDALGADYNFVSQLLSQQRSLDQIIGDKVEELKLAHLRAHFEEQKTDFSIELPYFKENSKEKGVILEVDGSQHKEWPQKKLDGERDGIYEKINWHTTIRFETEIFGTNSFNEKAKELEEFLKQSKYINQIRQNFHNPFWKDEKKQEIHELALIPFAIARFQRILLEILIYNSESAKKEKLKLVVLERDVPFAQLAISDLYELFNHFSSICDEKILLPQIDVDIFDTKEFKNSRFQFGKTNSIELFNPNKAYDFVIDLAVLERSSFMNYPSNQASHQVVIRSIHYKDDKRVINCATSIQYKPFATRLKGETWDCDSNIKAALEYLLKSIFRKQKFRDGQLPIINMALQNKSVIGLLPTGGGKSLTYQFCALLQPGVCMVIDPLRSLMHDQVEGLKKNMIDNCLFINSDLKGPEKRKAMERMAKGEAQLVFVSPERLQMKDFRLRLEGMEASKLFFSYVVIDEAHCVSEWGHDFRTSYLRLGANAITQCKTATGNPIPLFGLTATASYDVLADVQRELSGLNEIVRLNDESVVRAEYSKRDELQFLVKEVDFKFVDPKVKKIKTQIGEAKQKKVKEIIETVGQELHEYQSDHTKVFSNTEWDDTELQKQTIFKKIQIANYKADEFWQRKNAGLIFCPHRSGMLGVKDVLGFITIDQIKKGYFMGSSGETKEEAEKIDKESMQNMKDFVNDKTNLMVATKAFGMGIDKENVRFTIHMNYPGSIESFVQEAGRAGRDWKMALSYILYCPPGISFDDDWDFEINNYFHKQSFKSKEKEMAILDELLNEVCFPNRFHKIKSHLVDKFKEETRINLNGNNLYTRDSNDDYLGLLFIDSKNIHLNGCKNLTKAQQILPQIKTYLNENADNWEKWILSSYKVDGILPNLKYDVEIGKDFKIDIGFTNNTNEIYTLLKKWIQKVFIITPAKTLEKIEGLLTTCSDAKTFFDGIEALGIYNFDEICINRDKEKGNPEGYAKSEFFKYFNGIRQQSDTEKAIYRLSILGIIDDYTVDYHTETFTLYGKKKLPEDYYNNLKNYILKYYSPKTTELKLNGIGPKEKPRRYLEFLVEFIYKEIAQKRKQAIEDMNKACAEAIGKGEEGNIWLKEFIDLYFNSRYARAGNQTKDGKPASLYDLLIGDNKKEETFEMVLDFIGLVVNDKTSSEINNYKHLRGACVRLLQTRNDSYVLMLLNAFSLYMLEYTSKKHLEECERIVFDAFQLLMDKEPNLDDDELEQLYVKFVKECLSHNIELKRNMKANGLSFSFENIMLSKWLQPIKAANLILDEINEKLN